MRRAAATTATTRRRRRHGARRFLDEECQAKGGHGGGGGDGERGGAPAHGLAEDCGERGERRAQVDAARVDGVGGGAARGREGVGDEGVRRGAREGLRYPEEHAREEHVREAARHALRRRRRRPRERRAEEQARAREAVARVAGGEGEGRVQQREAVRDEQAVLCLLWERQCTVVRMVVSKL